MKTASRAQKAHKAHKDWDAHFFIGIFPASSPCRWCKVHVFSGGARPGRHCLSALEGIDGPPSQLTLVGFHDGISRTSRPLEPGERVRDVSGGAFAVRTRDASFGGAAPDFEVAAPRVRARVRADQELTWIRVPRVLSYVTKLGAARATIEGAGEQSGIGLVERAWGAATRVDVARLAPKRWQWDVLWLGGDAWFAGLAFGAIGRTWGPHGGARLPEGREERVRSFGVEVHGWKREGDRRVPEEWSGVMRAGGARLRYRARASTPVAPEVDGGGFLGFDFEGDLDGRPVGGTGFSEYRAA